MSSFHKTLISAMVKSLLRGKSLIQAVLEYCFGTLSLSTPNNAQVGTAASTSRSIQDFLKEAEKEFVDPVSPDKLEQLSAELKAQFLDRLQSGVECMLPSYSHRLPTGDESGRYLALDVGGSTLRVALVELSGRKHLHEQTSKILSICNFVIGKEVKDLEGTLFFDWMAARIIETLSSQPHESDKPLPMAIAWSFPIEQTALGAGKLQTMGKGFVAHKGLMGRDLGELITDSCKTHGLNVEVAAIVNDSTACLLSEAFFQTSTRFGLILGTGVNIAAYLPISLIGRKKFGTRPDGWFDHASHVIVNTELGMFGYGILPVTRWDQQLLDGHNRPDFQPLEHMVSGMYLGEVARFALIEAIETTGIFGGLVPPSLSAPYALGTETLSMMASDTSEDLAYAKKLFSDRHPSSHKPTFSDIAALKSLASFISLRSSALVATCVRTLWDVRRESNQKLVATLPKDSTFYQSAHDDLMLENTIVAFNGSVIEHYPGYLESCQRYIDELSESRGSSGKGSIKLVPAKESSLLGTAVASACV